jgi:type II secretory pathway pseudopilin PulG
MSTARARKRGFTIIEAVVALALTGVTIAGVLRGVGALSLSQSKLLDRETSQRLAIDKYNEICGIQDFTTPSGDFTDRYDNKYVWEMTLTQVSTNSIPINSQTSGQTTSTSSQITSTNLETLKVTVHPQTSSDPNDDVSISGLVYVPSQTDTTAAPTGGTTG